MARSAGWRQLPVTEKTQAEPIRASSGSPDVNSGFFPIGDRLFLQEPVRPPTREGGMQNMRSATGARSALARCSIAAVFLATTPQTSLADEGGISFWIPGFFGSLAATPQQPGFSFATIYYHTSVDAGADVAFARQ